MILLLYLHNNQEEKCLISWHILVGYQWNLSNDIHVGFIYESYMYVPVPLCEHIIGLGFGVYWVWDY